MVKWIADVLFIAVASLVGNVICIAVERQQLARMVFAVAVMMALLLTIQDLSPVIAGWGERITSIQNTLSKVGIGGSPSP